MAQDQNKAMLCALLGDCMFASWETEATMILGLIQ